MYEAKKIQQKRFNSYRPARNTQPPVSAINNPNNAQNEVKVIPLGGVEQIGMNCTAIEFRGTSIIIDCGLGFPENDEFGVDYMIPNSDYFKQNKHKIKAIFITHGHLDHIGGLHIIAKDLGFPPIYASRFAYELISLKFREEEIFNSAKFNIFKEDDIFDVGGLKITFFKVNHSTPEAFGIIVKTPLGNIVHTGDFKFDNSPVGEETTNYFKLAQQSVNNANLVLLSDSTNALKKGFSKSESDIVEMLKDVVEKAPGRIIVATFSQLVIRINQLIMVANQTGRKVAISGRSLDNTVKIAKSLGYIKAPEELFVPLQNIKRYNPEKQMIFTTGHQGENMAALSRIARGEHRDITIQKGDTVILSASVIPGNDLIVQKMIDALSIKGARVYHQGIMDLHAGGHGYQEDQKLMINFTKPKYFIPVHGYQSFLLEHMRTAQSLGMSENHTLLPKNGEEIIFSATGVRRGKVYKSEPVMVSGLGVGDIGETVLKERSQLANNGVVVIGVTLSKEGDRLIGSPVIKTRGFVYVNNYRDLLTEIAVKTKEAANELIALKLESEEFRNKLGRRISRFILKKIEREPVIIVVMT